jgi:hypothetical protein
LRTRRFKRGPVTETFSTQSVIARDAIGMPAGMVREDALIAASIMITRELDAWKFAAYQPTPVITG